MCTYPHLLPIISPSSPRSCRNSTPARFPTKKNWASGPEVANLREAHSRRQPTEAANIWKLATPKKNINCPHGYGTWPSIDAFSLSTPRPVQKMPFNLRHTRMDTCSLHIHHQIFVYPISRQTMTNWRKTQNKKVVKQRFTVVNNW